MKLVDLYVLMLRLAGVILGYYWVSAMVWAFYYFANPDGFSTWVLIAQYAIQGLLLYVLIFKTTAIVHFLFGSKSVEMKATVFTGRKPEVLMAVGIALIGLCLILLGIPSLILKLFSGHRTFSDYDFGFTLITKKEMAFSIIHIVLGIIIIVFKEKIAGWISAPAREPDQEN